MAGKNTQGNEDERDEHDDDEPDEDESLLDSDDDEDDSDDDGEDDDGESADELVDRVVERLGDRLDKLVEDKVRGPIRGMRREIRQAGGKDRDKGRRSHDDEDDARPVADVRAARSAAREYLSDSTKFTSPEERAIAMDLVQGRIAIEALSGFDDEDEVGRRVAREVAETVTKLRRHYVTRTKARLKRDGALVDKPGQRTKGKAGATPQSELAKGREIALARYGNPETDKT